MFILKYSLIQILDILGYADSSKVRLNETGVVHDAKVVFRFLKKLVGNSDIIVWGHSLGTGYVILFFKINCKSSIYLCFLYFTE